MSYETRPSTLRLATLAIAGAVLLQASVPATAALKHVIVFEALDAGLPPLLIEDAPELMEIAPGLMVRNQKPDWQPAGQVRVSD